MKKSVKSIMAVVALVAFSAMSFVAAKGIVLNLNLQKGKSYHATVKTNQTMTMSVQGQNMTQSTVTEQVGLVNVTDENTVVSKWESMKLKVSVMGQELTYDSKNPSATSPMIKSQIKPYEEMLSKEGVYKFDAKGNKLSQDEEELPIGPAEQLIKELPNEELVKGFTWEKETVKDLQGESMNATVKYTVKDVTKKTVVVDYIGDANSDNAKMTYKGTSTFDIATGMVMKDVVENDITSTMTEQGMTIPIRIIGTTETIVK